MRRTFWILVALLVPGFALADESRGLGSVGIRANGATVEGAQGLVGLGVSVRLKTSEKWAIEGAVDILEGSTVNTAVPLSASGIRYLFPNLPISPYGIAGVGVTYLRDDGSVTGSIDHSRLFGTVGFGAEAKLGQFVLSGDLRYLVMDKSVGESIADGLLLNTSEGGQLSLMLGRRF